MGTVSEDDRIWGAEGIQWECGIIESALKNSLSSKKTDLYSLKNKSSSRDVKSTSSFFLDINGVPKVLMVL